MSATSRTLGGKTGTGVGGGGARTSTAPEYSPASALYDVVATDLRPTGTVARLTLGLVMLPHALQKVFGWFGGYGLEGTYGFFTTKLGLPGFIAGAVIFVELFASLLLIAGAITRVAAAGILAIMIGAIITTHADNGFFMNWSATQAGEGYEYHLLAIGLAIVTIILGGGALSVDRLLTKQLRPEVDPVAGHFMGGDTDAPVSSSAVSTLPIPVPVPVSVPVVTSGPSSGPVVSSTSGPPTRD